ncbi:peptide chain release factor N(5)-glutamine methyltransferase [Sandaracinobacter neustonicus]|uniref:Release factor glutamine methyltransferase n=1 Tax=Sandaracinobacter neustonicus TaxID=1715348 RepID=A0A501XMW3_9SPHN|nr:peptide chain release factor N(5)-glutamine methyltransferase [Sandaracinobacter neustonicus]TPE61799.1 peptide chain release factor N(5)-glutamine methyltransferase [Sandaracinobacter neustonicus]
MPEAGDRHALLRAAAATLPGDTPRLDAELLLAHVLDEERLPMLMSRAPVGATAQAAFEALLARRRAHEPVAHLTGEREFWSLPIRVTRDVLVPRPDSETLIAEALAHFDARPPANVLDLGTGSGALLLAALSEWPQALGFGIDRSDAALAVARGNAARLGLAARAAFRSGDWAAGVEGPFDLILCNPPYIEDSAELMPDVADYEPASALFGGPDGLAPYRILLPEVPRLLAPGGVALFEFGLGQGPALLEMAAALHLHATTVPDLSGRARVLRIRC